MFLQLNDHPCHFHHKLRRLVVRNNFLQTLLDKREDELANLVSLLKVAHLSHNRVCEQLVNTLHVKHRAVLERRHRNKWSSSWLSVRHRSSSSNIVILGAVRCSWSLVLEVGTRLILLLEFLLVQISNQLNEGQQKLSLLCLQFTADILKLLNSTLILQVLQVPVKLQDVQLFIELCYPLILSLELIDVEFVTEERNVLSLVLRSLCTFQCLEGHKSEAKQVLDANVRIHLALHQVQVVHLSKL